MLPSVSPDQVIEAVNKATHELANLPDGEVYVLDHTTTNAWQRVYAATLSEHVSDAVTLSLVHLGIERGAGQWEHGNVLESCARNAPAWAKDRVCQIVEAYAKYMFAYQCRKDVPF